MTGLNSKQLEEYEQNGFVAPIDILSLDEVYEIEREIAFIEKKWPLELKGLGRYNFHLLSPKLDRVVHNSKILDAVESIVGSNFLVAGTTLFIKEPETESFASWHQDAKYQGFNPFNFVTAWLAVTEAKKENGCMWMWKGSHREMRDHKDQFEEHNILTRGQTVENVPKNQTIPVELKPGQLSLHHPQVVHASGKNISSKRRIGFVIQSYIGTDVEQKNGKIYVQQARGKDTFQFHEYIARPKELMDKKTLVLRNRANKELQKTLYKDSVKVRDI